MKRLVKTFYPHTLTVKWFYEIKAKLKAIKNRSKGFKEKINENGVR